MQGFRVIMNMPMIKKKRNPPLSLMSLALGWDSESGNRQ